MDTALVAAGVVFLAELGDKSQLVAAALGARRIGRSLQLAVVANALLATVASATVGALLHDLVAPAVLDLAAGLVFVGIGLAGLGATWVRAPDDDDSADVSLGGSSAGAGPSGVLALTATLFVAELGDRTMFATGGLAAEFGAWSAGIGAFVGMASAGLLGAAIGSALAGRVDPRVVPLVGSAVFVVVGLALLTGLA